ncbi:amidohydrolase family protein [Nocardia sp. NBC_01730]|uniref:amidohydrolase family protein n=1 Tax=Nocardia sp. NBC_01730 TaxID=2975998 RepID=UPI002E14AA75|nr:amidohydrolase family protein [Nocardia sp. NBC_01730]
MSRVVVKGGTVVTMEPGQSPQRADVLIEDDKIVAIEPSITADAALIDATNCVVAPGLVDTHRHVWQAGLRGVTADMVLKDYFRSVRFQASPVYRPEDIEVGNLAGMLEAIDAGVTSVLDFSHSISSPDHAEAAIDGTIGSGGRSQFALGFNDVVGQHKSLDTAQGRLQLAESLRKGRLAADDALVTLGIALSDLPEVGLERIRAELEGARRLGLRSTTNALAILFNDPVDDIEVLDGAGLLGPDIVWVHLNYASAEQFRRVVETGGSVSTCPEAEMAMGIGRPATERVLAAGGRCTLGCDVTTSVSGSLLQQARTAMQVGRLLDADERMATGKAPLSVPPSCETMLKAATIWGAEALGQSHRIGSLRPGKQADLIVVRTDAVNTAPMIDPYATLITQAQPSNIDTVVIAGEVRKSGGRLRADWSAVQKRLEQSKEHVARAVAERGGLLPQPALDLPW